MLNDTHSIKVIKHIIKLIDFVLSLHTILI